MNIDFTKEVTKEEQTAQQEKQDAALRAADALKYLFETDWYVTRKIETGEEIPEEILQKRAEARLVAGG